MGPNQVGQARIPKLRAWPKRWLALLKGLVLATRNIFHIAQNFDILFWGGGLKPMHRCFSDFEYECTMLQTIGRAAECSLDANERSPRVEFHGESNRAFRSPARVLFVTGTFVFL